MPWFDLPEAELAQYRTPTPEPAGLDAWWAERLAEARALAEPVTSTPHEESAYGPLGVRDVEFSGALGDRVRAWHLRPAGDDPLPTAVVFIGYGGGRGTPTEHAWLAAAGYGVLVVDTRGQGGRWTTGATADSAPSGPSHPGFMTRGITSPEGYYYTRLMTDAALAVDVAAGLDGVDPERIAVLGASQGGGLALAAAALNPTKVKVCHADVPFLCDFQRAITLTGADPYAEIANFLSHNVALVKQVRETLTYVDAALLSRRITATSLLSAGLMDEVCPPSTVFAAYNEITAPKRIEVFPFSGHAVPRTHDEVKLKHLREHL
ncbi:alpha/beta fold hydrolase [Actinosynnema pretiosum subsp. pretiosum]|uniref:Acetyl xylan esterase n=2 Tax=Actinosynnema TaxID=40566 RepID=C6WE33_ACTMD|nr:alpha/beta fold hydrolase [Actinosynnema mirum]ACU35776.1 Acetyl xylan esterase [Actinosynnema mirum DSM 43827]AXX29199.1 Acetyl xylan esterase [Actinosynnema pretiosum subsp. pretiosum]QUF06531.1 alpha/beta fold hydrolase [Actinosynnema pretiosum subsp. pretiosum]